MGDKLGRFREKKLRHLSRLATPMMPRLVATVQLCGDCRSDEILHLPRATFNIAIFRLGAEFHEQAFPRGRGPREVLGHPDASQNVSLLTGAGPELGLF